jgi:hypothetical protein
MCASALSLLRFNEVRSLFRSGYTLKLHDRGLVAATFVVVVISVVTRVQSTQAAFAFLWRAASAFKQATHTNPIKHRPLLVTHVCVHNMRVRTVTHALHIFQAYHMPHMTCQNSTLPLSPLTSSWRVACEVPAAGGVRRWQRQVWRLWLHPQHS